MQVVASQSTVQGTVQGCGATSKSRLALSMGKLSARARRSAGNGGSGDDADLMPEGHALAVLHATLIQYLLGSHNRKHWHFCA